MQVQDDLARKPPARGRAHHRTAVDLAQPLDDAVAMIGAKTASHQMDHGMRLASYRA